MKINHARGIRWETALVDITRPLPGPSLDQGSDVTAEVHPLHAFLCPSAGGRAITGAMLAPDAKPLQQTAVTHLLMFLLLAQLLAYLLLCVRRR